MFAKSFIALDGNGHLTGARTAQIAPYDRYTCHLCNSTMQYRSQCLELHTMLMWSNSARRLTAGTTQ
ncbi:hypothetical protein OGY35_00265 [Citrobacter sp. Ct235]|uniref:DUF7828 domain-containing protein n=1 Tax=Citrobacter sp. Ct235 TaxID=2985157 RepID=UPI0025783A78|nr:hypothetical protein [Citrobacter sp. Ct235]MDM2733832.1 hypothetical protein [Citrobacter sp. Ct235]